MVGISLISRTSGLIHSCLCIDLKFPSVVNLLKNASGVFALQKRNEGDILTISYKFN